MGGPEGLVYCLYCFGSILPVCLADTVGRHYGGVSYRYTSVPCCVLFIVSVYCAVCQTCGLCAPYDCPAVINARLCPTTPGREAPFLPTLSQGGRRGTLGAAAARWLARPASGSLSNCQCMHVDLLCTCRFASKHRCRRAPQGHARCSYSCCGSTPDCAAQPACIALPPLDHTCEA